MERAPNTFQSVNKTYTLNISLETLPGSNGQTKPVVGLDALGIELFEYSTKLNSLLVEGRVVYADKYAGIDRLFGQEWCQCNVYFGENKPLNQKSNESGAPDPSRTFQHAFIVTYIKPLERRENVVRYEIGLVSSNWFNCAKNVQYTNYDKGKEPILEILKNCIVGSGLIIDKDSFGMSPTNVMVNHISKFNDNLFTTFEFLMSEMYFMPTKDDSVKFIYYDMFADKYKVLDLKTKDSGLDMYPTILSMFKSDMENVIEQEPTNLGAFANAVKKTYLYNALKDKSAYGYSYQKNAFTMTSFESKELLNYVGTKLDDSSYKRKYTPASSISNGIFKSEMLYWNNSIDIYHDAASILEQNDALVLNIVGNILRQAGSYTTIQIDRSMANVEDDSVKTMKSEKEKYKSFEGLWYNGKVTNIICPNQPSAKYRQQVALFRNFMPDMAKKPLIVA